MSILPTGSGDEAMWEIQQRQLEALEHAGLRAFEEEMLVHFQQFSPQLYKSAGEAGARQVIRLGMANAERCGFTRRGPVRFWIEMMFRFGVDFHSDPLLPWVASVLSTRDADEKLRSDRLHSRCQDYLNKVFGPNNEGVLGALQRARMVTLDSFGDPVDDFDGLVLSQLRSVHPTKCEVAGQAALDSLLEEGKAAAATMHMMGELPTALIIGIMFALGHGALSDPLYPWISSTLGDSRDPTVRARRLHAKLNVYLDHAIQGIQ